MSKPKLPTAVPLPEIPDFTDDIAFGSLGFPVGFDDERVEVNLRALNRIRLMAGLGSILITAEKGDSEPLQTNITGIDEQGAATMGYAAKRRKKPLGSADNEHIAKNTAGFYKPDVTIKVDNTELENRIEEKIDKFPRGVFEPKARAQFLNKAVRKGLEESCFSISFDKKSFMFAGIFYGENIGLFHNDISRMSFNSILTQGLIGMLMAKAIGQNAEGMLSMLRAQRWSLFYGVTPDRWLAANALLAMNRKLISARV